MILDYLFCPDGRTVGRTDAGSLTGIMDSPDQKTIIRRRLKCTGDAVEIEIEAGNASSGGGPAGQEKKYEKSQPCETTKTLKLIIFSERPNVHQYEVILPHQWLCSYIPAK